MAEGRAHVPLGGDVELYDQMGAWAPGLAGFLRFDLDYDTPGLIGEPGVDLTTIAAGDVVLSSNLFVVVPFDVSSSSQGHLTVEGVGESYVGSFSIDTLNDWQSYDYASIGESLFGIRDPLLFRRPSVVRFYVDLQGGDLAPTVGLLAIVLRVLPAPVVYPLEAGT